MKRIISLAGVALAGCMAMMGQKPSIMVLPDITWCKTNQFVETGMRNGREKVTEDYARAFTESNELVNVESTIKSVMTESGREYPVLSYVEATSSSDDFDALDDAFESAESGGTVVTSAFEDLIGKMANAPDIYFKIGWSVNKVGLRKTIEYRMSAVDAFSGKAVAAINGTTDPIAATASNSQILGKVLEEKFYEFEEKLINHFQDIQQRGREVKLALRIIDTGGVDFASEFGGEELSTLVDNWLASNTVDHTYRIGRSTVNAMNVAEARIPFRTAGGAQNKAEAFAKNLGKYITATTGVPCRVSAAGPGSALIHIGVKR